MEERYNLTLNVLRFTLLIVTLGLAIGCSGKDDSLRQSEMLIRSGMHPEAINLLEKIIAVEDRNPKARFLLGQAYEGLGSYDQAIHNYRTAINLYAAHPEDRSTVRLVLAKVYLKQGLRERGYNELRTIVRSTSDSAVLQQVARLVTDAYEVAQLTSDKSDNYSPRFSPDGSQLAFASYRLDNGEIFIMDLDGRVRQRVTFTTDFDEGEPAFLHDPRHLIYSREPQTSRQVKILLQSSGSTPIYAGFYTTHIHSKVTQEIMPVGFGVRSLGISPDRQRVAYESNSAGNLELYTLDLRGVDLGAIDPETIPSQQITHNEVDDGSPVFFPDGKRLAFVSARSDEPLQDGQAERHQIYSINLDGSDETHLNPNPYDCYSPVVSPDGGTIAFVSSREGDIEIYLMDADGSNERRLTNGIGASMQPAFSPDSTLLAFVSDRSDTFQIYLMHFDHPLTQAELLRHLE